MGSHKKTHHPPLKPAGLPSYLPQSLLFFFGFCTSLPPFSQLHSFSPTPSWLSPWGLSPLITRYFLLIIPDHPAPLILLTTLCTHTHTCTPTLSLSHYPLPSFHPSTVGLDRAIISLPPIYLQPSFALSGHGAKSLPRMLDPSHRIYPRVAWQVWSTPTAPSSHSCSFPFSLSSSISCFSILSFFP